MATFLKWLGRGIIAATGIILIISAVVTHSPKLVACIITGAAMLGYAIYATARNLGGTTVADQDSQAFLGSITPETWYDWLILVILIVGCVVAFIV